MTTTRDRYTIEITGDNASLALSAAESVRSLRSVEEAAEDADNASGDLSGTIGDASDTLSAFQGPLGGIADGLGELSALLGSSSAGMVALGLTTTGVVAGVGLVVSKMDQLELVNRRTEAQLEATGFAAGVTSKNLEDMANRLALASLSPMEDIREAQGILLSFRSVGKDVFEEVIELSQGLAASLGGDVQGRVEQIGEALELPAESLSTLEESFIFFTEAEQDMIAEMEESGRKIEAQRIILDRVRETVGDTGSSMASGTLSGAVQSVSVRWGQFLKTMGEGSAVYEVTTSFVQRMSDGMHELNQLIDPDPQQRLNDLMIERLDLMKRMSEGRGWRGLRARLQEINTEISDIQEHRKAEQLAETEAAEKRAAYLKSVEEKRRREAKAAADEEAAERLQQAQDLSAGVLANLDQQYADEGQKIQLKLASDLDKIRELQVSKADLEEQGFKTLQGLQDHYSQQARDFADEQQRALDERRAREVQRELEKNQKILESLDQRYLTEKERIDQKLTEDLDKIQSVQLSRIELERQGFETLQELQDHYSEQAKEQAAEAHADLEERRAKERERDLANHQAAEDKKLRLYQTVANRRLAMERQLQGNILSLGNALAGENRKLQLAMLVADTAVKAKQAITAGYVAGAEAAKSLAGTGPQGPALAAAANVEMIRMGYANAAMIVANGAAQGLSGGGGGGASGGGYASSSPGTAFDTDSQDGTVISVADMERGRPVPGGLVIQGDVYTGNIDAIDSQSFAQAAMRNKSALAAATEAELNEYGRSMVR